MPFRHTVYPESELGHVHIFGVVTGEDIENAIQALFRDERWRPGMNALWDCRHIRELVMLPYEVEAIRRTTEELSEAIDAARSAVVVHREMDRVIALMLYYKRLNSPDRMVQIFDGLREGAEWLGIPVERVA